MAMQIMFASISGNNIKYPKESHCINLTANLKPICDEFFEEKTFLEDGEEIIIQVVRHEKVKEFSERIEKNVTELLGELKITKGDGAKEKIITDIKDYVLLRSLIISMLVSSKVQDVVLTIS